MRALAILFTLVALAGSAVAQAEQSAKAKAEAEAAAGQKLFDEGKYHDAAGRFVHANELDPQAPFLYNAATAFRLANDCASAAKYYRSFVDATKGVQVQNLDKVKHYIDDMDACAKTAALQPEPPAPVPGAVVAQPSETRVPAREPSDAGRSKRVAGIAIAAAGVAALAAGFGFAHAGQHDADLEKAYNATYCQMAPGEQCSGQFIKDNYADPGSRDNVLAGVAFAVGGAAVVGGIVMYVLGRGDSGEHPVAAVLTRGGAMVTAGWSF